MATANSTTVDHLIAYLDRLSSSVCADVTNSADLLRDVKSIAVTRSEQSKALTAVIQFIHSITHLETTDEINHKLLTVVWERTQNRLAHLVALQAELVAAKELALSEGNIGASPTNRKGGRGKKKGAKEDSTNDGVNNAGGLLPPSQVRMLELEREKIKLERALWIYLECIQLLIQQSRDTIRENNAMTAQCRTIAEGIAPLTMTPYVQSHDIGPTKETLGVA